MKIQHSNAPVPETTAGTFVMSDDDCTGSADCSVSKDRNEHLFYNHFGIIICFQKETDNHRRPAKK